jgi:hypothetical protein
MPRKLSNQTGAAPATDAGTVVIDVPDTRKEPEQLRTRTLRFKPFQGDTKKLAPAELDKRGRVKKGGAPEYYLKMTRTGHDLMKVYRNGKGVARRLVYPLKTILETKKCRNNRVFIANLKKAGLPVIQ